MLSDLLPDCRKVQQYLRSILLEGEGHENISQKCSGIKQVR